MRRLLTKMLDLEKVLSRRIGYRPESDKIEFTSLKWRWLLFAIACVLICFTAACGWFYHQISKLASKQKVLISVLKGWESASASENVALPQKLEGIPFAEDQQIVLSVQNVSIPGVAAPYNPALIPSRLGYDLFFRYDVIAPRLAHGPFSSRIGVVHLDDWFESQQGNFQRIDVGSEYADDPRVLRVGGGLYLFYNQMDERFPNHRFMCVANLDPNLYTVNYKTILDLNMNPVEKNWSPFEYVEQDEKPRLFLEYRIHPRKLLELPNPEVNELKNHYIPPEAGWFSLPWTSKWGGISGGTPAQKIGDEYLGFFHSWFQDQDRLIWYVMGAYTFKSAPPFHLTGISRYPLLFHGIYNTPLRHTAPLNKRVIFPGGFAVSHQNGRALIHLACGENDCALKIVTMDQKKLLESLLRFEGME